VCRVIDYPPDAAWKGKVGAAEIAAFFKSMGSPRASTYSPSAPHPYMQKTRTVEFCCVLEGEITLVLDAQEVNMRAGEIAVLRGANHAWSNRSSRPARISVCTHDGKD
jgi:quercetin dioxygenase-like cupin family protein